MFHELTPRERVVKTLKREESDRIPKEFWWTYQIGELIKEKTSSSDPLEYFSCEQRLVRWSATKKKRDFSPYINESSSWIDQEWGVGYVPIASKNPQHAHLFGFVYPMRNLKTVEELKEYPFSDYEADYRHNHLEHQVKQIHKKELCATAMMPMTIFEVSWQLRGMENLFLIL